MRISDWSSDVCSSDLCCPCRRGGRRLLDPDGRRRGAAPRLHPAACAGGCQSRRLAKPPLASLPQECHSGCQGTRWRRRPVFSITGDMADRSEEHTSELQSLMRISYAVFCLKKKTNHVHNLLLNE